MSSQTRWLAWGALVVVASSVGCKGSKPEIGPVPTAQDAPPRVQRPAAASPRDGVLRAFVSDVRDEKWDLAYALMASRYRANVSLDQFTRTVHTHPYFSAPTSLDAYKDGSNANTGYLTGIVHGPAGSYDIAASFVVEGADWRISALSVGGSEVLPRFVVPPATSPARKP